MNSCMVACPSAATPDRRSTVSAVFHTMVRSRRRDALSTYQTSAASRSVQASALRPVHLCRTGETGRADRRLDVARRCSARRRRGQRTRADETHIATHDRPQLRQFIETRGANSVTEPVEPLLIGKQCAVAVALVAHGAELADTKWAHHHDPPCSGEEHRAAELEANEGCDDDCDRYRDAREHGSSDDIQPTPPLRTLINAQHVRTPRYATRAEPRGHPPPDRRPLLPSEPSE